MKKNILLLGAALWLFSPQVLQAQKSASWEVSPGGTISWMRTTSLGNLIVSTSEGLKGINPETGATLWTIAELTGAPEKSFEEIQGTPYFSVVPKEGENFLYIIEPFEGKILFSSKSANIQRISSKYFLYENNSIILVGYEGDGKTPITACIDMASGKVRWTKSSGFSRLSACKSAGPDEIIITTLFFAYKLKASNGDEIWKSPIDPKMGNMEGFATMLDKGGANLKQDIEAYMVTSSYEPNSIYLCAQKSSTKKVTDSKGVTTEQVTYSSIYAGFNISDGKQIWPKIIELQDRLGVVVPCKEGLIVGGGDQSRVTLLDYKTGAGKWGKNGNGFNLKGPLASGVILNDKVMLVSGKGDQFLMLVDPKAGTELYEKSIKISGTIEKVINTQSGLVIASNESIQYIDKNTGTSYLEKALRGTSGLVAMKGDDIYMFNTSDNKLYHTTKSSTTVKVVNAAPLVFEGKEIANKIEITPDGILVSSDQNSNLVSTSGNIVYHTYFPAPKESGLKRALLYASAVNAAYYSVAYGYTSAAFGATSASIQVQDGASAAAKDITGQVSGIYGDASRQAGSAASSFMKQANKRFKATESNSQSSFVLSEVAKKEYQLINISKKDGSVISRIPIGKDKEPQYEIDMIENAVYYISGNKILGYR